MIYNKNTIKYKKKGFVLNKNSKDFLSKKASKFDWEDVLNSQMALQSAYHVDLNAKGKDKCRLIKDMAFSCESELHEMLQCVSWRDWSDNDDIDEDGVKEELRDSFQFFVNLMLVMKMSPEELFERIKSKQNKNWDRISSNYSEHINSKDSDGSDYSNAI